MQGFQTGLCSRFHTGLEGLLHLTALLAQLAQLLPGNDLSFRQFPQAHGHFLQFAFQRKPSALPKVLLHTVR